MAVLGFRVVALTPVDVLLFVVLAALGFLVVVAVCAILLAILQLVLPASGPAAPPPEEAEVVDTADDV